MAKVDHLQQLKGRTLSGPERGTARRRRTRESFSRPVTVTPHQAKVLDGYIAHELTLYNSLIENLYSRLKASPEFFTQLTDEQVKLFSVLTGLRYDVGKLAHKKSADTELPSSLERFRHVLFGIQGDKEVGLSDKLQVFYEVCSNPAMVLPDTREGMAHELIEFCMRQCSVLRQQNHEGEYKVSPETLEKVNNLQKRHLQIRKDFIKFDWDEQNEVTKLWIPHFKRPLLVQSNLSESPCNWNLLIIHKDPNRLPMGHNIPWEIDFKRTMNRYLIKYLECRNPMSQMESRFMGLRM